MGEERRRIDHWVVEEMVRTLLLSQNTCLVLHEGMMPKNGMPRIQDENGKRTYLNRYLYRRLVGEDLGRESLVATCKTEHCLNPFHATRSFRRSLRRVVCPNGHKYRTTKNTLKNGYRCRICYENRKRRNRVGEYGNGRCRKGHYLSENNTYWYSRTRDGKRIRRCRKCAQEAQQRYRERKAVKHE